MPPIPQWGLLGRCVGEEHEILAVKLESVDIQISIRGFVAKVKACLTYHNSTNKALEVEYKIPVDEGAAVYKFEAVVNNTKIAAQCMEKKKAEGIYKEAVKSGHTAVLAREDELTSDILHLALGNLPPGTKAELQVSLVMELKVKTDGAVDFVLPTVLNPRYCPADITPDQHTRSVAMMETPDLVVVSEKYSFDVKAKVEGGHEIARVISHSDPIDVKISDDKMSAEVSHDGESGHDHDWSLLLYYSNPYKTHIIRESGDRSATGLMKDDVIMVNLHPEIPSESYSNKNEVIFVVDRSGSMRGDRIQSAKATLLLFLKSLPTGCLFNVISFGSSYSLLFPKGSEVYSETTLKKACKLQETMEADMGGTEILQPLKQVYAQSPKAGYARQILLLSDGQVFNVDQVRQLVSRHAHETRMFSVGIGEGASTALIKGLARAGRGRSEMVYQQDKLQLKVMGLVKSMVQETVQDVSVNFEVEPPGGIKLVPKVPPIIFGGQHLVLYTRVPPSASVKNINIKGVIGDDIFSAGVQGPEIRLIHDEDMTLHRLAARAQINQWQIDDEENVAEDMIALSVASGVLSRRTALVGVDQDATPVVAAQPKAEEFQVRGRGGGGGRGGFQQMMGNVFSRAPKVQTNVQFGAGACPPMFAACPPMSANAFSPLAMPMMQERGMSGGGRRCKRSAMFTDSMSSKAMPMAMPLYSDGSSSMEADSYDSSANLSISCEESVAACKESVAAEDSLMAVVNLQKFDGSWTLIDAAKLTALPKKRLQDANVSKNEMAWATAVILVLLEKKYSAEKDQWELLANKARAYILSCGEDVKALVASAQIIFSE